MSYLTSAILSGIIWDQLKRGFSITVEYLREKLSNWLLDDEAVIKIKEAIDSAPEVCLKSEGMIKEYLNLDEKIVQILQDLKPLNGIQVEQNSNDVFGVMAGVVYGDIYNTEKEPPKFINGKVFSLIEDYIHTGQIQIVKSFESKRGIATIKEGNNDVIRWDICIPDYVRKKDGCQFEMILFSYVPGENWGNCFEDYYLQFKVEASENVHMLQLEIKNSLKNKFVDLRVKKDKFLFKKQLKELARRSSWSDVGEICFTVFADDEYITGEKGYIEISELQLVK